MRTTLRSTRRIRLRRRRRRITRTTTIGGLGGPINKMSSYRFSFGRQSYQGNAIVAAQVLDANLNQTAIQRGAACAEYEYRFPCRGMTPRWARRARSSRATSYNSTVQTNGGVGQLTLASQGYDSTGVTQTLRLSNSLIVKREDCERYAVSIHRGRGTRQTPDSTAPTWWCRVRSTAAGAMRDRSTTTWTGTSCRIIGTPPRGSTT